MTVNLAYEIIMSLPENERDLLFDMLEPHMKKFDLEELISDKASKKASKNERLLRLIDTCFSKVKDS
jgi:hypothetical protein